MRNNVIQVHPSDNVAVAISALAKGDAIVGAGHGLHARSDVPKNHKVALTDLNENDPVIKYGQPIGCASRRIAAGEWVHTDALRDGED